MLYPGFERRRVRTGSGLEVPVVEDSLRAIAALTQLEWLTLEDLRIRNERLASLAGLTNLKTLNLTSLATYARLALSHLPPLPRLEALSLDDSDIEDDDLRRLAALPRLKSLSLGGSLSTPEHPLFTPAGLTALGSLDSLEEMHLGYVVKSPEMIEPLGTIGGLKRLHLDDITFGSIDVNDVVRDEEKQLIHTHLGRFRRAFRVLRQSKPGLLVDTERMPIFSEPNGAFDLSNLNVEMPDRPAAFLPGGDLTWMTPKELADFALSGGRASFYGATYPGGQGQDPVTAAKPRSVSWAAAPFVAFRDAGGGDETPAQKGDADSDDQRDQQTHFDHRQRRRAKDLMRC